MLSGAELIPAAQPVNPFAGIAIFLESSIGPVPGGPNPLLARPWWSSMIMSARSQSSFMSRKLLAA